MEPSSHSELVAAAKAEHRARNFVEAASLYERAAEAAGAKHERAHSLRHAAETRLQAGQTELALEHIGEVMAIYLIHPAGELETANTLRVAGLVKETTGLLVEAEEAWAEAIALYDKLGIEAGVTEGRRRIESFKIK